MFNKILVPVDLQEAKLAEQAMEVAVDQARKNKVGLHVMTVVPGFGMPMVASFFPSDAMRKAKAEVRRRLDEYVKTNIPKGIKVSTSVAEGTPYQEVIKEAKKQGVDSIVLPSHDRGRVDQAVLGSCAAKVVENARCAVMVIRKSAYAK